MTGLTKVYRKKNKYTWVRCFYLMIIHKTNCLPLCMSQNHFTVFLQMSLITLCGAVAPVVTLEPGMWVEFPC